jgi:hypothetical protein
MTAGAGEILKLSLMALLNIRLICECINAMRRESSHTVSGVIDTGADEGFRIGISLVNRSMVDEREGKSGTLDADRPCRWNRMPN